METRKLLLKTALILTLLCAIAIPVYAYTVESVLYTKFNTITWTDYQLDKQYTTLTVNLKPFLTFNTTGTPFAKVCFVNGTTNPEGLIFLFYSDGTGKIYKIEGETEVQIATFTYGKGNITRLSLASGKITVYEYYDVKDKKATILSGFAFGNSIGYLRVKGDSEFTATDGYFQVEVNVGASGGMDITEWLPSIISLAMLAMCFGMIKRLG